MSSQSSIFYESSVCRKAEEVHYSVLRSLVLDESPMMSKVIVLFDGANFKNMNVEQQPMNMKISDGVYLEKSEIFT